MPHDAFFSFLLDMMRNILMRVSINDPFASNLGIDDNWIHLDYHSIFIIPVPFFFYVEYRHCKPNSSVFSHNDCIHMVMQQIRDNRK